MHIKQKLADINYFIKNNGFRIKCDKIRYLVTLCNYKFGSNPTMLYFEYVGYNVNIIFAESYNVILSEQIEIVNHLAIEHKFLIPILNYSNLSDIFLEEYVESIYADDNEKVIIILTGPMLYYNKINEKFLLVKIIQSHQPSKDIAIKLMDKVY